MPEVIEQDELKAEELQSKLEELTKKEDKTDDELKEFNELRGQVDKNNSRQKIQDLSQKFDKVQQQLSEKDGKISALETQLAGMQRTSPEPVAVSTETEKIGEEVFRTDNALRSMIDAGKISEAEAVAHQQSRIEAKAADKAYNRLKSEQTELTKKQQVVSNTKTVFDKHPEWDGNHPNHNPNDPVFKTANEFFLDGLDILKAMKYAERIHGVKSPVQVDNSDNLSLHSPSAPPKSEPSIKNIELADWERENAIETFTRGDLINPSTNRVYTESEAIARAKQGKLKQLQRKAELRRV